MSISINNIIETITNPAGRFKTLEGIYFVSLVRFENSIITECVAMSKGEPTLSFDNGIASFIAHWNHKNYILQCDIIQSSSKSDRTRKTFNAIHNTNNEYFSKCAYKDKEMLVFDSMDNGVYINVAMTELPDETNPLNIHIGLLSSRGDRKGLWELTREFCRFSISILQSGITHCNIQTSHIIVSKNNHISLVGYKDVVTINDPNWERNENRDNYPIAKLVIGLFMLSIDPSINHFLYTHKHLLPKLESKLLLTISKIIEASKTPSAKELLNMIAQTNDTLEPKRELIRILETLSYEEQPKWFDVKRILINLEKYMGLAPLTKKSIPSKICINSTKMTPLPRELATNVNSSNYQWLASQAESLICFCEDEKFGYINSNGSIAIEAKYDWADDFAEGRAVAQIANQMGLIDKTGAEIIPLVYEDLIWGDVDGIAIVCKDGKYGILDRKGETILPPTYDWMGNVCCGLIAVSMENKYGYLKTDGSVAIELTFDDAYDFSDDKALVIKDMKEYYIDTNGNQI